MGKRSGNRKQGYVNCPHDQSKLTCLIHGPGHSSEQNKLLNYFATKYSKGRHFKKRRQDPTSDKKVWNNQEVSYIFQQAADEIILQENKKEDEKLSVKNKKSSTITQIVKLKKRAVRDI